MIIGGYTFRNPWILAPMAGVSEMPYRLIALEMGAAAAPTELVSAKGLIYGQDRTRRYLTHSEQEQPFWVQVFGGDPEVMGRAAECAAKLGARILDINMGCPVKKVTRTGAGSALLADPERAAAIVESMRRYSGLPVTVKIRAGWDDETLNFSQIGLMMEQAGAAAIAMHARTRAQGYSGAANWGLIKELVQSCAIPVIGNGDAWSAADARAMMDVTGCAGVMIGRGALGNPWIFQELSEPAYKSPSGPERWEVVRRHFKDHLEFIGSPLRAVRRFRSHLQWYSHGMRGNAEFRKKINVIDEVPDVLAVAKSFFSEAEIHTRDRKGQMFEAKSALG